MESAQLTEAAAYVKRVQTPSEAHRFVEKVEIVEKVEKVERVEKLDFQCLHAQRAQAAPDAEELRRPRLVAPQQPKQSNPATAAPQPKSPRLVARPLGYVLERLPSAVSGRVQPLYQSYAAPAVEKVDGVLFAVGDRGFEILGGARAKISMLKPWRVMAAAERAVDRVLPPSRRIDGEEVPSEADSEDAELSTFRRGLALLDTIWTRAYVHSEVKIIMMKVKTRVWFDMTVTRRYKALVIGTKSLQSRAQAKALASKNTCLAYEKRAETYVVGKCTFVKSTVAKRTTAVASRASALKKKVVESLVEVKEGVKDRVLPYTDALKERVKPLTSRLSAWFQKLREVERKCVAYAVEKKNLFTNRAKAVIATVEENIAEKYDTTRAIATKYTSRSINYARAKLEKVLGRDRSAKLGGLLNRYTATIAQSVRAHAA